MDKSLINTNTVNKFVKENNIKIYLIVGITVFIVSMLITMIIKNKEINSTLTVNMDSNVINENIEKIAGVTTLRGEGIVITLEDGEEVVASSTRTDTIVHDSDILSIINELKAAGAEAILVNDQRIISSTAIRCVGPVVQINFKPVASPFIIKAIGNSKYLNSALNIKNGVVDILKNAGININIEMKDNITIDPYTDEISFKYAK